MHCTERNTIKERAVTSPRLPSGVATTYNPASKGASVVMRNFLSAWRSDATRTRCAQRLSEVSMLELKGGAEQITTITSRRLVEMLASLSIGLSVSIAPLLVRAQTPAATAVAVPAAAVAVPAAPAASPTVTPAVKVETALNVVVLLPTESPLLRRAAMAVRDGIRATAALSVNATRGKVNWIECGYNQDEVVTAYQRCVTDQTDWVIGPLGRNEVSALTRANPPIVKSTLLLSPLGALPKPPFTVLAPDLESEAEAIVRQAGDDACRKPILVESAGAISSRVSVTISTAWRAQSVTPLASFEMGARDRWQRASDGWRKSGVDCVLFAGGSAALLELRPYLLDITVYATSASYEVELERTSDWTGVRIADASLVIDGDSESFAPLKVPESLSPTLIRLFSLGVDAAQLVISAREGELPQQLTGAIGGLKLQDGQYRRAPMIGEFRGRTPVRLGR
ncbi:MAG: hypothetical protein EAZ43_13450 [Betaproteobacteria bacterium]|nr:MAG: hypothetical protein EAZ43_13450 [Betaproteobacteria bacterium]